VKWEHREYQKDGTDDQKNLGRSKWGRGEFGWPTMSKSHESKHRRNDGEGEHLNGTHLLGGITISISIRLGSGGYRKKSIWGMKITIGGRGGNTPRGRIGPTIGG